MASGVRGTGETDWLPRTSANSALIRCPAPMPVRTMPLSCKPPTNARVVDPKKCIGCKMCQRACPWEMMSFDSDTKKATKCFLCDGKPKCVEACPAEALIYVAWRDLTDKIPRPNVSFPNGGACRRA